jgi:4'-phosphopantetheinyl transferase EntD
VTNLGWLLPDTVVSGEAFADVPGEPPFPGEEDLVARAVEGRRREFITARRLARAALAELGYPAAPIRTGPKREPIWPAGVVGALTHCAGYRAAAAARRTDLASLGIDAEPSGPLPEGVAGVVMRPAEHAMIERLAARTPGVPWDRLLFSAKESVYKAWFPLTGRWLGFEEAELTFEEDRSAFRARILIDGTRTDGGPPLTELAGRFLVEAEHGLLITAVTVPTKTGPQQDDL